MSSSLYKGQLQLGQEVLRQFVDQVRDLELPDLGPEFKNLSGTTLNTALVRHRIVAKFEVPESGDSATRKGASISRMLAYDREYVNIAERLFKGRGVSSHFLAARAWLNTTLRGFKRTYRCPFPSGESVISAKGEVDLWYKLSREDQWSVSHDCVDYAARIAYQNHALKKLVKARFYATPRARYVLKDITAEALSSGKYVGFYVFKRMFAYTCTIVGYSRLTTVPKNNTEDRVITCDPTWNLVVQRSIALDLIDCLRKTRGINLHTLQVLHRSLIANREYATIDLSKASDSNWLNVVTLLFPQKVTKLLLLARTGVAFDGTEYHRLNQLSPMGNGFTFEVMTLTLLAYARVLDPGASVFGDDIIIRRHKAHRLMSLLRSHGWKINEQKTFTDGNFSESCGGFYNHSTKEHIVSFDFWYPESISDLIVIGNKLYDLLEANQVDYGLRSMIRRCYHRIVSVLPDVVRTARPVRDGEEGSVLRVEREADCNTFSSKYHDSPESPLHSTYTKNNYAKRVVFVPDIEFEPPLDGIGLTLWVCYLYQGVKPVGPRSGTLRLQTYCI